jgi:hypothetical protein
MIRKDWAFIDTWSKKIKAINHLGGKCQKCNNTNVFHLTFHHRDKTEKESKISDIRDNRWSEILKEINKCDLLCRNCHMELHHDEYLIKESSTRNNKKIFLEIKGTLCELCGYDKCNSSLVFHHVNPDEKEFRLAEIKIKFDTNVEKIMNELNKCQLLCQNCHQEIHIDRNRFEKFKEEIYKKSKSTKERQGKIDRTEVYELYKNGMKKADIARHFCASRGTITDILKKL